MFIFRVTRQKKADGIGNVNQHGMPNWPARCQIGDKRLSSTASIALAIAEPQAQLFSDLEPTGPLGQIRFQLGDATLGKRVVAQTRDPPTGRNRPS